MTIVAVPVSATSCAPEASAGTGFCHRCGTKCWLDQNSRTLVAVIGARVVCNRCHDDGQKPDLIVIVREENFWEAVRDAKKIRDRRREFIQGN